MSCPPAISMSRLNLWTRFNTTCPDDINFHEQNKKRKTLALQHKQNSFVISKSQQYIRIVKGLKPSQTIACELKHSISLDESTNPHPIKRTYRGGSNKYPYSGWSYGSAGHPVGKRGSSEASRAAAANELKNNPHLSSRLAIPTPSDRATIGSVTTLAGSSSATFADGIGSAASFFLPRGVAFSPDGRTIAVADRDNHRVRLITWRGVVTTLAGSGTKGSADATGVLATFNEPTGVAYSNDGSTIAVADYGSHKVRLITVATGAVTTLAGSGEDTFADGKGAAAKFNYPRGVAYSPDGGKIAVADGNNFRIRLIETTGEHTGTVTTLAGTGFVAFEDGPATEATFNYPTDVAYSPDGSTIAVADDLNNRVRLIDVATRAVTTIAGNSSYAFADGTGGEASFNRPHGVAYSQDGSTIAVGDSRNNRVRLINVATRAVTTLAGSGSPTFADGTGSAASFNFPAGVDYSPDGSTIAVADRSNHRVRLIDVAT